MKITNSNYNIHVSSAQNNKRENEVYFASAEPILYPVKNATAVKKILPILAFTCASIGALGYLLGGTGLYYDLYVDKKINKNKKEEKEEGVKTIKPTTKIGKIGINCGKVAVAANAISGISCGLGEGIPLMALGESMGLCSSSIIETPVGTALFGIGIGSIFAGLALDNTPELKLNHYELMAQKGLGGKSKLILENTGKIAKEILTSIKDIGKHIVDFKWLRENLCRITPNKLVFTEKIDKAGNVFISKALRHDRNYMMNAASFTLALGGLGIILSTIFKQNKAQKKGLQTEEAGFLFDNLGMTKYGVDKFTTGGKPAGASFAVGGIINAISQFIGLDNKNGRALQWLGISGVFIGFAIDRGKHLKEELQKAKAQPALQNVLREWKLDLSKVIQDKTQLKKVLKELKSGKTTNVTIRKIELALKRSIGHSERTQLKSSEREKIIKEKLSEYFKKYKIEANMEISMETIAATREASAIREILKICSEKIFGKNPLPISKES